MATNTGLLDLENEYEFTDEGNYVHYIGHNEVTKNFMWYVGFVDTENGGYMVCRFFASFDVETCKLRGDWGGCPEFEPEALEELNEFFDKLRNNA